MSRALALAVLAWAIPARAATHPRVSLEIDACLGDARDEIRRVVLVELGDLLASDADAPGERTRASIACDGPVAVLRVDDPVSRAALSRRVDLGAAPPRMRPRLVALALAELISASWSENEPTPPPRSPDPAPAPLAPPGSVSAVASLATPAPAPSIRVAVTGGALRFSGDSHTLAGGGVRVASAGPSRIGWMIDAQAQRGSDTMASGQVSIDVVSAAAAATLRIELGHARLELGAGLRGGEVEMGGTPSDASSFQGSSFWARWFGALALGQVTLPVTDRVGLDGAVEAGCVLSPVEALVDGHRADAVSGAWLTAQLGLYVQL